MTPEIPLELSEQVADVLSDGGPVVALESTIITHGLPSPRNVETALAVEQIVSANGAVPATIAVIDGVIRVGLSSEEVEQLAGTADVLKLSRADFAAALVQKTTGSTTVAATMIAARLAGIKTFATGGIGGVHRGAELSFDISADLQELAQTSVTVVAAGAKAILDLPKTLEVLETLGVPVIGYRTDDLPAFWSRESGLRVPIRLDTAREIADCYKMRQAIGLIGGQLVVNPIPHEAEIPASDLSQHIETAISDADAAEISGKEVTPFVLARVLDLTDGRSLDANVALIQNNAALAAEVAVSLTQ